MMARICLDAGHSGHPDPGAINELTGLQEADVTLDVAYLMQKYLASVGYEVMLTRILRKQLETNDLAYRTELSNNWKAHVFVSLHCNSADNPVARGYEIWTLPWRTGGDELATCLFNRISQEYPDLTGRADYVNGDPERRNKFYVLTHTEAPACLVEMAFISNPLEAKWLADPAWLSRMAWAISLGIVDYFGEMS